MSAPGLLLVGAGGIGAPAALALASSGARLRLVVVDDDLVERTNLHRQLLFSEADVGRSKVHAFRDAVRARAPGLPVEVVEGRVTPDTAAELVASVDVVVDATDNFATRFLLADAARLVRRPVVHAAAVRWSATVLAAPAGGRPCYRCLFEDLPEGPAPDCATAGVVGPVCGVAGALAADLALRVLRDDASAFGRVHTYDGRADALRVVPFRARRDCDLCGVAPTIATLEASRYTGAACSN